MGLLKKKHVKLYCSEGLMLQVSPIIRIIFCYNDGHCFPKILQIFNVRKLYFELISYEYMLTVLLVSAYDA
jgi:hypothetical protein